MAFFEGTGPDPVPHKKQSNICGALNKSLLSRGVPAQVIRIVDSHVTPMNYNLLHIHEKQVRRNVPPHVAISSVEQIQPAIQAIASIGYEIEYLGSYSFRFSSISLCDMEYEVVKLKSDSTRYRCGSWFAAAFNFKNHSSGKSFTLAFVMNSMEMTGKVSKVSTYNRAQWFADNIDEISESALKTTGANKGAIEDFISYCREQQKVNEYDC